MHRPKQFDTSFPSAYIYCDLFSTLFFREDFRFTEEAVESAASAVLSTFHRTRVKAETELEGIVAKLAALPLPPEPTFNLPGLALA